VSTSRRRADQTASLNKRETAAAVAAENEALEAEAREAEARENESFDNESTAVEASEHDVDATDAIDATEATEAESDVSDAHENEKTDTAMTEQEPVVEASSDETVSEDTTEETN
jgi:hypothetical protein